MIFKKILATFLTADYGHFKKKGNLLQIILLWSKTVIWSNSILKIKTRIR
jgi:hypothetical protein